MWGGVGGEVGGGEQSSVLPQLMYCALFQALGGLPLSEWDRGGVDTIEGEWLGGRGDCSKYVK